MLAPLSKAGNKLENWITHTVMISYMTIISKAESTLITLVEGFYGTRKRITQSFTLTLVYIVTMYYLRSSPHLISGIM